MKVRQHIRAFEYDDAPGKWVLAVCRHLDHALAPLATACLVLGLLATILNSRGAANYMLATGLLLHLTIWFAGWLGSIRRNP